MPGDVEFRDETKLAASRAGLNGHNFHQKRRESLLRDTLSPRSTDRQSIASSTPFSSSDGALTPNTPLGVLRSPAANRVQLYNTFMDIYIPQNILPQERGGSVELTYVGFIRQLASLPSSHPALSSSMGALSLVSTGNLHRDKRLLSKAVEEYTIALNKLATAVARPDSLHDDSITATIMLLCLCEFYDEIKQEGQGWVHHQNGLHQLLAARGPESFNGGLSSLLLANARTSSLTQSMLSRRKDVYDSPNWREVSLASSPLGDDVGIRLPALMERHDNLALGSSSALQDIDALLSDCAQLEYDLRLYLESMASNSRMPNNELFNMENTETFSPFSELVVDRTFTKVYRFPSFTSAFLHSSHWIRMHLLRTMMKSLQDRRFKVSGSQLTARETVTEGELLGYALDLCRCIPYLIEPSNNTVGEICCFFPLFAAATYFKQHEHLQWLGWVYHVRSRIFNKGLSMPVIDGGHMPSLEIQHLNITAQRRE